MPKPLIRVLTKKVVIFCNLVVVVLFLLGCYGRWFLPAKWWFIGMLTLSVFWLFILLLFFFIFWLFLKSRWSLLFLITIAVSWEPITSIVPLRMNHEFRMEKQEKDLRLMTWNVAQFDILDFKKNHAVHDSMIALINRYDPDIACFQEMVAGDSVVDLNTPYYKKFSFYYLPDFAKSIGFTDYFYSYNYKENYLNMQHFGILVLSKYPIINKQTVSYYPHDYNSIFQYIDILKGNDTIRVFNLHLQSLKFSPANLKYIDNPTVESQEDIKKTKNILSKFRLGFIRRQQQADRIKLSINQSPYPVVVCGDFNDVANSYAYETIGDGLLNCFETRGAGLGRTYSGISPSLRIDNIFTDKKFLTTQYHCEGRKLSDHFPVIADIQMAAD